MLFSYCRFNFSTTCYEGRSKLKCYFDCVPHSFCGLLQICQANSTFCKYSGTNIHHLDIFHNICFFTSPDQALWNMLYLCRRQCLMSMPCVSHLLGVQCCYHYFCFLSFYQRTWSMPSWHATSLCLGSLLFRMFLPYETIIIYNNWNIIRYLFASLSYIVSLLICQGNTFTCY